MARRKIKSATDQRPFIMVYQDFLESELLDNHYQKLVYVYLKKFADSKNQCFPSVKTLSELTKISINKVKLTLAELEQKGVIAKENRTRQDGGKSSNLYTLYDHAEIWSAGSSEEIKEIKKNKFINLSEIPTELLLNELKRRDKEKELDKTEPTKVTVEPSTKLNQFDMVNITANSESCQELERYTEDQIRQIFDYDILVNDHPLLKDKIDSVFNILHTALNTKKDMIRVGGEDKPTMVVVGKLMKLGYPEIMYCIEKYNEQTDRIKNPTAYMLTLLYNAKERMNLDISNQVQHDMYNWEPEPGTE